MVNQLKDASIDVWKYSIFLYTHGLISHHWTTLIHVNKQKMPWPNHICFTASFRLFSNSSLTQSHKGKVHKHLCSDASEYPQSCMNNTRTFQTTLVISSRTTQSHYLQYTVVLWNPLVHSGRCSLQSLFGWFAATVLGLSRKRSVWTFHCASAA